MNDDLISRQAAIDFKVSHGINEDGLLYVPYGEVKEYLEQLPSTQPERKTGRWIRQTDTRFGEMLNDILICSECNIAFPTVNMIRRSYCPNCGAKMDAQEDEE